MMAEQGIDENRVRISTYNCKKSEIILLFRTVLNSSEESSFLALCGNYKKKTCSGKLKNINDYLWLKTNQ